MDRAIVYADAIPQDVDVLNTNKNAMIGLGLLAQALLGTGTVVDGLACTPTAPATMTVNVGPGSIYGQQNVDNSAYGSLAPDTTDQIVKQGIVLGTTNFSCPAPSTSGFSIGYLIEASYADQDAGSAVLPYYNASNPSVAYNGPNNTGVSQNTVRKGVCVLTLKAGTAATTGTEVLPAADVGAVPLYAITVANGQTTITSGNILQLSVAPFINPKLPAVLAALQSGAAIYAADTSGSANTIAVSLTPAIAALAAGLRINVKVANTNTGAVVINTNTLGNVPAITQDGNPLPPGAVKANGLYGFIYDGTNWQLQAPQAGDVAVGQCVLQYTSATVVTLAPKNGNRVSFPNGTMQSIGGGITATYNNCSINGTAGQTLSANTLYYIYLVSGSTPFLDFSSSTAYTIDSTSGITIKTGDATRVLVGMVSTDASGKFVQTTSSRQVRSWFNDHGVVTSNTFSTTRATASTSLVEVNTEIRNNILTWAGENVVADLSGSVSNGTSGNGCAAGIGVDSTSVISGSTAGTISVSGGQGFGISTVFKTNALSEGLHFFTYLAEASTTGTVTFSAIDLIAVSTAR